MKIALVSYATEEFKKKQRRLTESAIKFGVDKVYTYDREGLEKTEFYFQNKKVLDGERGAGYWVWKPYIILSAMMDLNEGDALIYCDSGAEIVNDVHPLINLCKKQRGILLFDAVNKNYLYTKTDCFKIMKCNALKYKVSNQFMGGYQVYIKNKKSIKFLKEYLKYVQIAHIIDDSPSRCRNHPSFIEHRHDQSILTNLAIKHGIKGFRNPSQGGNHLKVHKLRVKGEYLLHGKYSYYPDTDSNYPTIFYNKRNAGPIRLFLIKLKSWLNEYD